MDLGDCGRGWLYIALKIWIDIKDEEAEGEIVIKIVWFLFSHHCVCLLPCVQSRAGIIYEYSLELTSDSLKGGALLGPSCLIGAPLPLDMGTTTKKNKKTTTKACPVGVGLCASMHIHLRWGEKYHLNHLIWIIYIYLLTAFIPCLIAEKSTAVYMKTVINSKRCSLRSRSVRIRPIQSLGFLFKNNWLLFKKKHNYFYVGQYPIDFLLSGLVKSSIVTWDCTKTVVVHVVISMKKSCLLLAKSNVCASGTISC